MLEWSLSASMMRDPWRTGIDRVVVQRDDASCFEVNIGWYLWIDNGIVTIPLFKVDVPLSGGCVCFVSMFLGIKKIYNINFERFLEQTFFTTKGFLGCC